LSYLILFVLVFIFSLGSAWYLFLRKKPSLSKKEIEELVTQIEQDHYMVKHTCGKMTPVRKRFVVSQSFECIHCNKVVIPKEVRCPRCNCLVKLKNHTPLFHNPLTCKACKKRFELPGSMRLNESRELS